MKLKGKGKKLKKENIYNTFSQENRKIPDLYYSEIFGNPYQENYMYYIQGKQ